jgi:hypothetical protein
MPRFFFHLHDGQDHRDEHVDDHADFEKARISAVRLLGQHLTSSPERFERDAYWRLEISGDDGLTLTVLHLSEISAPAASSARR